MNILESKFLRYPPQKGVAVSIHRNLLCSAVLGIGMLLAGCIGDGGVIDPDPDRPISVESRVRLSGVSVEQVIADGIPQRQSRLSIPFTGDVSITGCTACRFEALVRNPLTDEEELREMRIDSLFVDAGDPAVLIALISGPVPAGSVFSVTASALSVGGATVEAGSITFPELALTPTEAALWFKAFVLTIPDLFPSGLEDGVPAVNTPQSTDPDVVRNDLDAHFQHYLNAGILSSEEVDMLLARFDDAVQRRVFTDSNTGTFEPHLMAMVLATAGTVGAFAIETLIDGDNHTGAPAVVFYDPSLNANQIARVRIVNGQYQVQVNERARNQPFVAFSGVLAHEAFHQDDDGTEATGGQNEEIAAKAAEIDVWRQHLLVNPELATSLAAIPRFNNLELLMRINSGHNGYPTPGLLQAPLTGSPPDVVPEPSGTENLNTVSLEDFLRNNVYFGVADVDSPGNQMVDRYISAISGIPQSGLGFNDATLKFIDNPALFTPEEDFRILQILRLQLSGEHAEVARTGF